LTGSRMSRVPLAVHKLGEVKKLQAKVIRTNWDELRKLDVPCLLSVKFGSIRHCSCLLGIDDNYVTVGEPLRGLIKFEIEKYTQDWKWSGQAVIVAPDFLHTFNFDDTTIRANELFDSLKALGYSKRDKETVKKFQSDYGIKQTGVLDWRTILVIDSLTKGTDRPHLSNHH
ncbi:MAG: cysteine peptidase family C39 domain-containing protein, partial [Planctomycetota bacterium]